jgi:hypothetical protein
VHTVLASAEQWHQLRNLWHHSRHEVGGNPLKLIQHFLWADLHVPDIQNIVLMKKGGCKEVFRLSSNLKIAIIVQKDLASISPAFPWIIFEQITARKT